MVSTITCTYGNVAMLEETLATLLAQDWPDTQIVIANSFPNQKLVYEHPKVKILNLETRPPSLGDLRNIAIENADGEVIVVIDSDDFTRPFHVRAYAEAIQSDPELDWVLLGEQFFFEKDRIVKITPGAMHMFGFTKRAWKEVGGYPKLTCGEDRDLVTKISTRFKGKKITLPEPSFLYTWARGNYHASGGGYDKPDQPTAHDRIAQDLERRVACGQEKTGTIILKPTLRANYEKMARDFVAKEKASAPAAGSTCIVQLGRAGDVFNALPIAKHIADTEGKKPYFMISHEFAKLLDGVSYVIPYPVDFSFHDLTPAIAAANKQFERVVVTQIYGKGRRQETQCESFSQESWRVAGYLEHYHDPTWNLVFDKRDSRQEFAWARRLYRKPNLPKILTNLTSATTAPFARGDEVLDAVRRAFWGTHEVIDIGKLRLPHMYDLLGLIDRAKVFVSIDTATLHLAAASTTPLVALKNDAGWCSTVPRYNCVAVLTYAQATPMRVIWAINRALGKSDEPPQMPPISGSRDGAMVFHHSGDWGDIIYGLTAIKALGGGVLVLSPDSRYPVRQKVTPETFANIAPLLKQQAYLKEVIYSAVKPNYVDIDLNAFRAHFRLHGGLAKMQQELCSVKWPEDQPWLEVAHPEFVPDRPICVNRASRWQNPSFPWKELVSKWRDKMFFVGTEGEHRAFVNEFGEVPRVNTPTLLEVARFVAGAKVCVGSQSCPLAIAHGLCKPVVQEVLLMDDNCHFNRPKTLYCNRDPISIPEEWLE